MQGKSLTIELTDADIHKLLQRYHFTESDYESVMHLYYALLPLVKAEVFIEYNPGYEFIEYNHYVVIAVTLGEYIDRLIALYSEAEKVSQAYIIDCIGLELLMHAYRKALQEVHVKTGLWVQQMEFLGDKYPINTTLEILQHMQQTHITCNEAFMMSPPKSTVFVAELTDQPKDIDKACTLCKNCKCLSCPNRIGIKEKIQKTDRERRNNMNYGYQRIFGEKENMWK